MRKAIHRVSLSDEIDSIAFELSQMVWMTGDPQPEWREYGIDPIQSASVTASLMADQLLRSRAAYHQHRLRYAAAIPSADPCKHAGRFYPSAHEAIAQIALRLLERLWFETDRQGWVAAQSAWIGREVSGEFPICVLDRFNTDGFRDKWAAVRELVHYVVAPEGEDELKVLMARATKEKAVIRTEVAATADASARGAKRKSGGKRGSPGKPQTPKLVNAAAVKWPDRLPTQGEVASAFSIGIDDAKYIRSLLRDRRNGK
ncbi:hypothetical protein [Botrimarina mediterranea]|uniref:hypothetical protein n=1 Tax=Botrimarina mediterranea TaxID=2528022 RepID=UPI00118C2745|nr:hypothetical protein K2D_34890 [Planctomycetes bacterium K2D]